MIIIFIGPSSSGKDTFFKSTLETFDINPIILHTTRPIRIGEVDGKTYYFITKDQLDLLDKQGKLIERRDYKVVNDVWSYATSSSNIDLSYNYITLNTWQGYKKYLEYYTSDILLPIYFDMDPGLRLQRALNREKRQLKPNYEEMCRRFLSDNQDYTQELIDYYKPFLVDNNGDMKNTQNQLNDYLESKLKIKRKNYKK